MNDLLQKHFQLRGRLLTREDVIVSHLIILCKVLAKCSDDG